MSTSTLTRADLSPNYAERVLADGAFGNGLYDGFVGATAKDRRAALREARATYAAFRAERGYAAQAARMLTRPESQAKLAKSERFALGLMLTPERNASDALRIITGRPMNLCPSASAGCAAACLYTSGHGAFAKTQAARVVRTAFLFAHPYAAGVLIGSETRAALDAHGADNVTLRLNVTSDIRWELVAPWVLSRIARAGVRIYDYTAWAPSKRAPQLIDGYALTYSAKETAHTSDAYLRAVLESGANVAMPFAIRKDEPLPATVNVGGRVFLCVDGDATDDRTTDPRGVDGGYVIALRAKGSAGKADESGFIRDPRRMAATYA